MANTDFSAVQQALEDLDFPATKEGIVQHVERAGSDAAVRLLKALPLGTYRNISEIRSSVPLDPAADDGLTAADKAARARSEHSQRIAEHLREPG